MSFKEIKQLSTFQTFVFLRVILDIEKYLDKLDYFSSTNILVDETEYSIFILLIFLSFYFKGTTEI